MPTIVRWQPTFNKERPRREARMPETAGPKSPYPQPLSHADDRQGPRMMRRRWCGAVRTRLRRTRPMTRRRRGCGATGETDDARGLAGVDQGFGRSPHGGLHARELLRHGFAICARQLLRVGAQPACIKVRWAGTLRHPGCPGLRVRSAGRDRRRTARSATGWRPWRGFGHVDAVQTGNRRRQDLAVLETRDEARKVRSRGWA